MGCPDAAAKAAQAAAAEATEAPSAATCRIARTPSRGYAATREAPKSSPTDQWWGPAANNDNNIRDDMPFGEPFD